MKILFYSTAPWGPSSYSVLTQRTVPEIVRLGYEVVIYAWYGLQGAPQKWPIRDRADRAKIISTVMILPHCGTNPYGIDTALAYFTASRSDVMITNMDIWVMPPEIISRTKCCPWAPVDHDPVPQGILDSLKQATYPMCYSKWGTQLLKDNGINAHYLPCSADTETFKPLNQAAARERVGMPKEAFIVSMIAANKDPGDRKGFGEALSGFAKFAETHEDAYLYVHTNWMGPINIAHLAERLGIQKRIIKHDQLAYLSGGYNDEYMNLIYNASDVLLNSAKSEGFGLPVLEAQMAGCPVAVSDFSTTDELLFAGWKIGGQKHWSIGADSFRLMVSIDAVVDALEAAYAERGNELLRKQARKGATAYNTQTVAEKYWKPALAEIEDIVCGQGGELRMVTF